MSEAVQGKEMPCRVSTWLWMLGALLPLIASLIAYDGKPNSDADLLLAYAMLALSFPLGLVIAAAASLLGQIAYTMAGYVFTTSYASIIVTWLVFLAAGYVQWFLLLPWLWRKWKARQARSAAPP
jgi:hypothetical protein